MIHTGRRQRRKGIRTIAAIGAFAAAALAPAAALAGEPCGRLRFIAVADSHGLTVFGEKLDRWLLAHPEAELASFTLGGASPEWLLRGTTSPRGYRFVSCEGKPLQPRAKIRQKAVRTPVLEELIRVPEGRYEKQVVILTLGSNVPGLPSVHTSRVEKLVRIVSARPEAICIWVGPPAMRNWSATYAERVYQAIRDGIRAAEVNNPRKGPLCHLIDSRQLSEYPAGGDGTHYGFSPAGIAAASRWADGVIAEVEKILRSESAETIPKGI
jgi:hypothetical protein